jgi:hypothetical protein
MESLLASSAADQLTEDVPPAPSTEALSLFAAVEQEIAAQSVSRVTAAALQSSATLYPLLRHYVAGHIPLKLMPDGPLPPKEIRLPQSNVHAESHMRKYAPSRISYMDDEKLRAIGGPRMLPPLSASHGSSPTPHTGVGLEYRKQKLDESLLRGAGDKPLDQLRISMGIAFRAPRGRMQRYIAQLQRVQKRLHVLSPQYFGPRVDMLVEHAEAQRMHIHAQMQPPKVEQGSSIASGQGVFTPRSSAFSLRSPMGKR